MLLANSRSLMCGVLNFRHWVVMCLLVFFSLVSKAQNFPIPIPVRADHLIPIEISLKSTKSGAQRAVLQLQEANILYNRPQKRTADLTAALNSAMRAAILAQKHGNQRVYNDALYMAALANADLGALAHAATLLPRLNDTTKTNALLLLAHYYWWRFDDDKAYDYRAALTYAEEALRISETSNNIYKTLLTRRIIAQIHGSLRNPSAETEFLDVIKSYKALHYPYMHYVYSQYAYFLTNTGKQNEALNYSLAALKSVQATKDSAAAGDVNLFHSIIIAENDMFSESLPYAFTAIDYYQKFPGLVSVSDPFLPLVISHEMRKMGDNDRSLAYLHASMKKYPPQSLDERLLYMSMLGHTYREKKMYNSAAFFFHNAYRIARANHSSTFRATRDVGHLYLELEKYDVARKYLYESLNFPAVMYNSAETKQLRFEMFMADSATGHYKAALKDMSKFKDIDNAELRAATNKHIRELEAKYENALKEVEIRKASDHIKLLGQQNAVQSLRISHNKFITTIMIVGLLAAAFIIATIFYFYRQKTAQSFKISE